MQDNTQDKIAFDHLTVLPDRIEARVRVIDPRYRFVTAGLIAETIKSFPTVPYHACRNEAGPTFGSVMERTSIPHLLEHLVIDMQTHQHDRETPRRQAAEQAVFTGTTQWSAEDPDVAIVRVSFLDDLIALSAFKKALHFINQTLAQEARA